MNLIISSLFTTRDLNRCPSLKTIARHTVSQLPLVPVKTVNPDNGTPASNLDHRPLSRNCQTHSQKKVSLSPNRQKSDTSP